MRLDKSFDYLFTITLGMLVIVATIYLFALMAKLTFQLLNGVI
ncbi:hypothetical protein [Methanobrevibacter intestini]